MLGYRCPCEAGAGLCSPSEPAPLHARAHVVAENLRRPAHKTPLLLLQRRPAPRRGWPHRSAHWRTQATPTVPPPPPRHRLCAVL